MTNEQLAVLLHTQMRDCNQAITRTDIELQCKGLEPELIIQLLLPIQGFADSLKAHYESLIGPQPQQVSFQGQKP